MEIINFEKSKSKKEFIDSYYNIYKIEHESYLYDTLNLYISMLKRSKRIDMCKFETDFGIIEYCLDLDIYYKTDCYYMVLVLTDVEKFEKTIPIGLKKITVQQFKNEMVNKFERFDGFGTGKLLEGMSLK